MESKRGEGGVASVQENTTERMEEQQQELAEAQATLAKLCCNTIKCNLN